MTLLERQKRLMDLRNRCLLLLSFGARLKMLRIEKGFTPSQFEVKSGIDAGNLAKYENGLREPGLVIIVIMAKALEVHQSNLVDFDFEYEMQINNKKWRGDNE